MTQHRCTRRTEMVRLDDDGCWCAAPWNDAQPTPFTRKKRQEFRDDLVLEFKGSLEATIYA